MTTGAPASQGPLAAPINWNDLIDAARALLNTQPPTTRVTDAAIRRAISTAYYAMFHALVASNAETLVGLPGDQATLQAWTRIYRNTSHRNAYNRLQSSRPGFSPQVQTFTDCFRDLQDERHNADYNPLATITLQSALYWIDQAEAAIRDFLLASRSELTLVASLTVVPGSR